MGKYMRKSKAAGDAADTMPQSSSSLGARARAKTLALRKLQRSSYRQLRSRKLEKPPLPAESTKGLRQSPNCKTRASFRLGVSSKLVEENQQQPQHGIEKLEDGDEIWQTGIGEGEGNFEAFVGENSSNFAATERSTRESMPCSFVRDLDNVGTPGSSTSAPSPTKIGNRTQNSPHKLMPKAKEVEEFFAGAEQQQHRQFIEKYNFDPVKEKPLRDDMVGLNRMICSKPLLQPLPSKLVFV